MWQSWRNGRKCFRALNTAKNSKSFVLAKRSRDGRLWFCSILLAARSPSDCWDYFPAGRCFQQSNTLREGLCVLAERGDADCGRRKQDIRNNLQSVIPARWVDLLLLDSNFLLEITFINCRIKTTNVFSEKLNQTDISLCWSGTFQCFYFLTAAFCFCRRL